MHEAIEKREDLAATFACPGTYLGEESFGSGHINDTYKVHYEERGQGTCYIRQRINRQVFKDIPAMMQNIGGVTRHLAGKAKANGVADVSRHVLTLIPTVGGLDYHVDDHGEYWRMYECIEDAVGYDIVEHPGQAFEAARAFGEFQSGLADLPLRLHETIPNFHHTRSRFDALMYAAESDPFNRAADVKADIAFAQARESLVDVVLTRMAAGELPERVTHNDTKLNNVLLDSQTEKGLCVIDLDTVMPGSALYDFGDMVRTMTTTAAEDEADLSRVNMNMDYFAALVKGYLEAGSGFLVSEEKDLLAFSGKLITLEVGIRFLTDYLLGDTYFKIHRERQNLDRCRSQFRMVESIEHQMEAMQQMVENFG
jgi:hypothetical protein